MFKIPVVSAQDRSINWENMPCVRINLPLFNPEHPTKIHHTDIVQGDIGSCWFLAVLISYIRPNSKNIEQRTSDLYKSIVKVESRENRNIYKVNLNGKNLYVDDYIPESYARSTASGFFKCIWYILFEKAMMSLMTFSADKAGGFSVYNNEIYVKNINIRYAEMKAATVGIGYLISKKSQCYVLHKSDSGGPLNHITAKEIYNRFKRGDHVMANTARMTYPGVGKQAYTVKVHVTAVGGVQSHCYTVIDMSYSMEKNTYLLTIQNPWGHKEISEGPTGPFVYPEGIESGKGISVITWEKFHHLFACVHMTL
jgi:hypothetical protein